MKTIPNGRKIFKGTILDSTCQCREPKTGEVGCWFFTGGSYKEDDSRVSPVFSDLHQLFQWGLANGIRGIPGSYRHVYEGREGA